MSFLSDAGRSARGGLLIGLVVLACGGLLGAGCGGDDESSTSDEPATGATSAPDTSGTAGGAAGNEDAAIALFDASCASCHTLSVADASGAVGPNLDTTTMSKAEIETQIRNGGGAMPAFEGQLSDADISSIAELVSSN
jgi:mono/diheme cytochrome c family protein